MRVLIVLAHPEPASFNAAMAAESVAVLEATGHEVRVSDLNAMAFDPVSDRRNVLTVADADPCVVHAPAGPTEDERHNLLIHYRQRLLSLLSCNLAGHAPRCGEVIEMESVEPRW